MRPGLGVSSDGEKQTDSIYVLDTQAMGPAAYLQGQYPAGLPGVCLKRPGGHGCLH